MNPPISDAAASVVPALTAPRRVKKLNPTEATLDNGLRVLAVRRPGVPLVEVRLRIPFLSSRAAHAAKATLLSDTMLTGTPNHDRAGLAAAVQGLGAALGVGVDADRLLISASALASNFGGLLTLMAEALTSATYPGDEVDTERERLVERLTIARSRAGVVAGEALAQRMYGDHPYAHDLPQPGDVEAATARQLLRLHADFVRPGGAVLVVVGDIAPARAITQVGRALADWQGERPSGRVPRLPAIESGPLLLVDRPGSVQSSLRMAAPALSRADDGYAALQLANTIFGGYFSSRWTENIREDKGYTYGPHSRIEQNGLGAALVLDADVATEVTAPALVETLYELGRIAALPVTPAEVEAVRQYAIGTMALSIATQAGLASTLSNLIGNGLEPSWLAEHSSRLAKVTVDEVSAAAAEYLGPANFVSVVVGDASRVAAPLAAVQPVITSL
jgi:predicted Zn-dependent peptidase